MLNCLVLLACSFMKLMGYVPLKDKGSRVASYLAVVAGTVTSLLSPAVGQF